MFNQIDYNLFLDTCRLLYADIYVFIYRSYIGAYTLRYQSFIALPTMVVV